MMFRHLGQVDPVPPPVRPINWPMILGWTAVVGMTLAHDSSRTDHGFVWGEPEPDRRKNRCRSRHVAREHDRRMDETRAHASSG